MTRWITTRFWKHAPLAGSGHLAPGFPPTSLAVPLQPPLRIVLIFPTSNFRLPQGQVPGSLFSNYSHCPRDLAHTHAVPVSPHPTPGSFLATLIRCLRGISSLTHAKQKSVSPSTPSPLFSSHPVAFGNSIFLVAQTRCVTIILDPALSFLFHIYSTFKIRAESDYSLSPHHFFSTPSHGPLACATAIASKVAPFSTLPVSSPLGSQTVCQCTPGGNAHSAQLPTSPHGIPCPL